MAEVWLAFVAGMAGSGHCLGMCGGMVAAFCACGAAGSRKKAAFFNLGRICTYAFLGFTAGLFGQTLDLLLLHSVSMVVFAVANLFVIVAGIGLVTRRSLSGSQRFSKILAAVPLFKLPQPRTTAGYFPLGLTFGFLPCGLVYATLAAAATTGSLLTGGAMMAALGLGTFPALFFAGALAGLPAGKGRNVLPMAMGIAFMLLGAGGIWRILRTTGVF